jgi:hypothetical protein
MSKVDWPFPPPSSSYFPYIAQASGWEKGGAACYRHHVAHKVPPSSHSEKLRTSRIDPDFSSFSFSPFP